MTAAAIAVAIVASGPSPAMAKFKTKKTQPEGGRIVGKIFEADGNTPVTGAVVRAVPLQGDRVVASSPSSDKGEFEIAGLTFGYFDLVVEAAGETFVSSQVVNVPPAGKLAVQFALTPYAEKSASWWAGREPRPLPDGGSAVGSAEIRQSARGAEFWKSSKGIAIIAGIGGATLLAIAAAGGGSSTSGVSPSTLE